MTEKTKEVVINRCYGGFKLSPLAIKELAKMQGKKCFFYKIEPGNGLKYVECSIKETGRMFWMAFDTNQGAGPDDDAWYTTHALPNYHDDRENPNLIKVVKKLGARASTDVSELEVVEIPADVEYTIEEYDGNEHIAEVHRTWR